MGCHEGFSQKYCDDVDRVVESNKVIKGLHSTKLSRFTFGDLLFILNTLGYRPNQRGSKRFVSEEDLAKLHKMQHRVCTD